MADEVATQWPGSTATAAASPSQGEVATQWMGAPTSGGTQGEVPVQWPGSTQGGPQKTPVGVGTSLYRGLTETAPEGVMKGLNMAAAGLAGIFGDKASQEQIFQNMEAQNKEIAAREAQRAQTEQQGMAGRIAQGVAGGLPQILTAPATGVAQSVEQGQTTPQTLRNLGVDVGTTAIGAALPMGRGLLQGAAIGAVTNPALAAAGNLAKGQALPTQQELIEQGLSGLVVGGGFGKLGSLHDRVMQQESGGDQSAVSPKGATGVMQVMPATGPEAARLAGLPWDPVKFKNDAAYNSTIGQAYLDHQVQTFGDETLGVAAYNAGAGNVSKWIKQFGDPRKGEISMDDFISKIPFDETRNYVRKIQGVGAGKEVATQWQQPDIFANNTTGGAKNEQLPLFNEEPPKAIIPEAPVPDGHVRMYHGGSEYVGGARWLTPDRSYAEGYANKNADSGAFVHYIDVPENYPLLQKAFDDTGTSIKAPYAAFEAPEELANKLKPLPTGETIEAKSIVTRPEVPPEMQVDNNQKIAQALDEAVRTNKTQDIGPLERELVPITELAKAQQSPVMTAALDAIERATANGRELFRSDVLGEQYTGNPFKSGHEIGGTGMADWLNTPDAEKISALEKYKQYEGTDTPVTQELLGASDREWNHLQNLRMGLDEIARKNGIDVAPNYLPKSRLGDWGVLASNADGYHFESATSKIGLNSIIKDLRSKGYNIHASGLKEDLYNKPGMPALGSRAVADHNKPLGDLFAGHREAAAHIPGWSGQRNTKDLLPAIAQYVKRAEFDNIRDRLVQVDKALRDQGIDEHFPRMYQRLRQHMDAQIGMGFIHQTKFGGNLVSAARRNFGTVGDLIVPSMHTTARIFNTYKVMAAPIKHIIAGTLGSAQTAAVFLAEKAHDYGINSTKLLQRIGENSIRETTGPTPQHLQPVVDRALRSGYLLNPADILGLSQKTGGNAAINFAKEMLKDPGRTGRVDMKARKDFFLGAYEHGIKDMKMSPENAFHQAGKWTREAFIGTRPEDRAMLVQRMGALSPIAASLTTYANNLAGRLYAYTANRQGAMAPLLTIFGTSIALAGLRGQPLSDLADLGIHVWNMLNSNQDHADKRIASFDNFMLDMEKQYPQMRWVLSGMPSAATGVDMSRSLSWPSIAQLVPGWEATKATLAGDKGQLSPPVQALTDALGAFKNIGMAYARGEQMGEYEKQRAIQALAPRQFSQMGKTTTILNPREEQIGQIKPEDVNAANLYGVRSLAEAEVRGQEADVQERLKGQQERIKLADKRLIDTLTAPGNPDTTRAVQNWVSSAKAFGDQGIISDPSQVINGAMEREMGRATTPQQRAAIAGKMNEVLLRMKVGQ